MSQIVKTIEGIVNDKSRGFHIVVFHTNNETGKIETVTPIIHTNSVDGLVKSMLECSSALKATADKMYNDLVLKKN